MRAIITINLFLINISHSYVHRIHTLIALSYLCMPLQHSVTGPAAQVPDPDRLIPIGGQATVRQHDQEGHRLYREKGMIHNNNNNCRIYSASVI